MALTDLIQFENTEVIAIAIGLLVFVLVFNALKGKMDKGVSIVIGIVLGFLSGYYLYRQGFYGYESSVIGILLLVVVAVISWKILFAFGKGAKRSFGN